MKAERSATNGGRALNAIWECQGISSSQAIIMLYLGSQLDFRGDFTEFRWCSVERISHATKLSPRKIFYHFKDLIERGYLAKQNRFKEGRQLASAYALTDKVFDEYVETLNKQSDMGVFSHAASAPPGVQPVQSPGKISHAVSADRAPSDDGELPQKKIPSSYARARVNKDDDGALSLKKNSEDLESWREIDQRPLADVGVPEIDWPGLMKLKRIGASTGLIEECITSFVAKLGASRPIGRLKNPTGLLVAQIAAKVGGLGTKPSDVGLANRAFKDVH